MALNPFKRKPAAETALKPSAVSPLLLQHAVSGTAIALHQVFLGSTIQNLNATIERGSWVLLKGPHEFAKALFCDLCFRFIKPESGEVSPSMGGNEVSFLGRSNSTYGASLLDHLTCATPENPRELMELVVRTVFGPTLQGLLHPDSPLKLKNEELLVDMDLSERDYLEIAEANFLLQRRPAVVMDTTSDFYQAALEQGFRHSKLFLESGKTIFWILNDQSAIPSSAAVWDNQPHVPKLSLYFGHESRAGHIN